MEKKKPQQNNLPLVCSRCKNEWVQVFNLPMAMESFSNKLTKIKCPMCGSGSEYIHLKIRVWEY
jgi:DNA-directed RNA polymerase subunit RPC12/RpoP